MQRFKYIKYVVFSILALLAAVWLFFVPTARPEQNDVMAQQSDAVFNLLLLGCDGSGVRPDTVMLLHFDGGADQICLLSLPRDSKVYYDGAYRKLNTVLALSDKEGRKQVIEKLCGITVDYYLCVDLGVFAELVDALGGVEYTVEKDMYYSDPAQGLYIDLKAGTQTLDGEQCEEYCRYRSYTLGDYTRTQHQQKLLRALIEQKLQLQYIVKLPALYNIIKENADTDITAAVVTQYLPLVRQMGQQPPQIVCYDCPGEYNDLQKERISYYQIDQNALYKLCENCF